MSRSFAVLAIGIVALAGCNPESPRANGEGELLAAGIPGAVAATALSEQDSTPIVVRRVWGGPQVDLEGGVSYDGRYLSFVDWYETGNLAVRDLKTGEVRRLTDRDPSGEGWEWAEGSKISPDGEHVTFSWYNSLETYEVRIVGTDGTGLRTIYRDESVEWVAPAAWSPDGEHILAHASRRGDTSQILLISVADGYARVLKTTGRRRPKQMSFSPDGRYVIYDLEVEEGSVNRDVYLIEIDGSHERPLVEHPANDFVLGWAPDGEHILFASGRMGTIGAWLLKVKDGKPDGSPRLVKPDMWRMTPLGFTRDGSYYYGVSTTMRNVYIATLDMSTGELLAAPAPVTRRMSGKNTYPAWSPNGRYLAYQSVREQRSGGTGFPLISIRSVETGEIRQFRPKHAKFVAPRLWSKDGQHIIGFGRDEEDRFGLFRVHVQTGEAEAFDNFWGVDIAGPLGLSPDGRSLYYKVWLEDGAGIAVRGLEGGSGRLLYRWNRGGRAALSPDASYLAFDEYSEGRGMLMVMPSSGEEPRVLVEFPPEGGGPGQIAWTPDGKSVVYRNDRELWCVGLDGGEARRLEFADGSMRHVRFHPDGRRIAYDAERGGGAEVWVMEDFLAGG
ncbi:MAG: PD40 domain-containing protein [Gemmatimonadota bacterium]|nr:MAG: PD40 domain-containing protein [Gemmatimonadota bacterium]